MPNNLLISYQHRELPKNTVVGLICTDEALFLDTNGGMTLTPQSLMMNDPEGDLYSDSPSVISNGPHLVFRPGAVVGNPLADGSYLYAIVQSYGEILPTTRIENMEIIALIPLYATGGVLREISG